MLNYNVLPSKFSIMSFSLSLSFFLFWTFPYFVHRPLLYLVVYCDLLYRISKQNFPAQRINGVTSKTSWRRRSLTGLSLSRLTQRSLEKEFSGIHRLKQQHVGQQPQQARRQQSQQRTRLQQQQQRINGPTRRLRIRVKRALFRAWSTATPTDLENLILTVSSTSSTFPTTTRCGPRSFQSPFHPPLSGLRISLELPPGNNRWKVYLSQSQLWISPLMTSLFWEIGSK